MIKGGQVTPNVIDRAKTLIKRYFDDKGFKERRSYYLAERRCIQR